MSEKKTSEPETKVEETAAEGTGKKPNEGLRVLKYVLFAASAGIIQTVVFTLLNEILNWAYWPCYFIALICSVIWNFTFNRKFTFKAANNIPVAMLKTVLFYAVFTPVTMIAGNYCDKVGINHYIILFSTMLLNLITEFLYQRFYTFKDGLDTNANAKKSGQVNEAQVEVLEKENADKKAIRNQEIRLTVISVIVIVLFVILGVIFPSLYKLPHKINMADKATITTNANATSTQTAAFDKKSDTLTINASKDGIYLDLVDFVDVPTLNDNPMLYVRAYDGDIFTAFAYSETLGYKRIDTIKIVGGDNAGTYTFKTKNGKVSECKYDNGKKTVTAKYLYSNGKFAQVTYGDTLVTAKDLEQTSDVKVTKDKKHNITDLTFKDKDGKAVTIKMHYNKDDSDDYKVDTIKTPQVTEKLTYGKVAI